MPWADWGAVGQSLAVLLFVVVSALVFANWLWDLGDDS